MSANDRPKKPAKKTPATKTSAKKTSAKKTSAKKPAPEAGASPADAQRSDEVTKLLEGRAHPLAAEIELVRRAMVEADPRVLEAVKWNSASYKTRDFFATLHLRAEATLTLIFHTGAVSKRFAEEGLRIDDPEGLCTWLAKDRCRVELGRGEAVARRRDALVALVRQWIAHL
jgi:hypothetical protein